MTTEFKKELEQLLNSYSVDNACNTPDFILAQMLINNIEVYKAAVMSRDLHIGWRDRITDLETEIKENYS